MEDTGRNRFFNAIDSVLDELQRQDDKWGGANRENHPVIWLSILTEEVGEVATEVNESGFNVANLSHNYRTELVQVAAVALQAILHYDNNIKK